MSCLRPSKPWDKDPFKNNEHFQFTNLFLCGLLSRTKVSLLEHLVSPKMLKKKREVLKSYLSDSVKSHLKNLPRFKSEQEGCKVHGMPNFIWMLRCIFETQSEEVGKLTAKGISADYIKLTYCNAYSADCSAINFVLHHCRKQIGLDLDNNNINDYGVKQLQPCFSKLSVVRLCVNQITDCGVEVLAKELVKTKIVKVLGMWGNTIGDEGAIAFAEALRNHPSLTNLRLIDNKVTVEGAKLISQALAENQVLKEIWRPSPTPYSALAPTEPAQFTVPEDPVHQVPDRVEFRPITGFNEHPFKKPQMLGTLLSRGAYFHSCPGAQDQFPLPRVSSSSIMFFSSWALPLGCDGYTTLNQQPLFYPNFHHL
ncbi:UNVERIFIED_CONTAM: hypothetical protein FKN15_020583 [Acipenser sinensis]